MAPVTDRANLYGDAGAGKLSEAARDALPRVYVPNVQSNDVYVIDPATLKVVGRFNVGLNPQHVVPSWDLKTLWVTNNAENTTKGSLTPIDPQTGKPARRSRRRPVQHVLHARRQGGDRRRRGVQAARLPRPADDGAQVVAGDAALRRASTTPTSRSTAASRSSPASSAAALVKIDLVEPQGARLPEAVDAAGCRRTSASRPTAATFYVADMMADGVFVDRRRELQGDRLHQDRQGHARPLPEPRRQEALRRQPRLEQDPRRGERARAASRCSTSRPARSTSTWPIPGGGSPDMGNVSADGKQLWLSGRYDNVVYAIDTTSGEVQDHPGRQRAARPHRVAAAGPLLARPHRQHALKRARRRRRSAGAERTELVLEVGTAGCGQPWQCAGPGRKTGPRPNGRVAQRVASTSAATAASTPPRPRRCPAPAAPLRRRPGSRGSSPRSCRRVADAKDAARERAEAAGDRDLEALARDRAQRLGVDAGATSIAVTDTERAARHLREQAQRAAFGPARRPPRGPRARGARGAPAPRPSPSAAIRPSAASRPARWASGGVPQNLRYDRSLCRRCQSQ